MLRGKTIGVVVPAFNEERLIARTLSTMPDFVDHVIVVNDGSRDGTQAAVEAYRRSDPRVVLINHEQNEGLGQSLIDGMLRSRAMGIDVTAVMDGDGQMDPADLPAVVGPVVDGAADFCKGNRLLHREVARTMPAYRLVGNAGLTFLTKFATGYWQLMDPQCAYSAISGRALAAIPIERMVRGYGYNADLLNMLNIYNFRVAMVQVKPVYGDARSGIKLRTYIPRVSWLLVRLFFRRLLRKYIVRNFNPLCLSYLAGLALLLFGSAPFAIRILYIYAQPEFLFPQTSMLCFMFVTIAALQILLSAVQYDMEDNRHLFVPVDTGSAESAIETVASADEEAVLGSRALGADALAGRARAAGDADEQAPPSSAARSAATDKS
jgi:glycosyltransferase involved in cell wall biosynthesis